MVNKAKEEKIAEFIGIMLGDGSIGIYNFKQGNRTKQLHQLKVTLDSRNKQYINYVSNLMEKVMGITPKIHFKRMENAVDIRIFKKDKVLYAVNALGLKKSPKWNNMEIPENYAKGKLALLVLRGLFDTDGSVTIFRNNGILYPRIEIRMSPCPAQKQIIDILKENNFSYKIQKLERGKIKIRISGVRELKQWFNMVGSSNELYKRRAEPFLR
jgi:intein/homing endonuclease